MSEVTLFMAGALFFYLGGLLLGVRIGSRLERIEWVTRAVPPGDTPHHCDGRFYYVIEEGYFCREYRRVPDECPPLGPMEYIPDEQEGE